MTYGERITFARRWARKALFTHTAAALSLGAAGCADDAGGACGPGRPCPRNVAAGVAGAGSGGEATVGSLTAAGGGGASGATAEPAAQAVSAAGGAENRASAGGVETAAASGGGSAGGAAGAGGSVETGGAATGGVAGSSSVVGTGGVAGSAGGCAPGFQDCNGDRADGCEVDTRNDVENCGACDRACSSDGVTERACRGGLCSPRCNAGKGDCWRPQHGDDDGCETDLDLPSSCGGCGQDCGGAACTVAQLCEPVELAASIKGITRIAVTSSGLCWDDLDPMGHGRIVRMPLDGGPTSVLFDSDHPVYDLTDANGDLYFTQGMTAKAKSPDGAVLRIVSYDDSVRTVVAGIAPVFLTAVDSEIYWTDGVDGAVHRANWLGEKPEVVSPTGLIPFSLSTSYGSVFATTRNGSILSINGNTFAEHRAAFDAESAFVAGVGTNLYVWLNDGTTARLGRFDTTSWSDPSVIFTEPNLNPLGKGLAALGNDVFFVQDDGIYRIDGSGGTARLVASTTGFVLELVPVGYSLYWVELGTDRQTGSVHRVNVY